MTVVPFNLSRSVLTSRLHWTLPPSPNPALTNPFPLFIFNPENLSCCLSLLSQHNQPWQFGLNFFLFHPWSSHVLFLYCAHFHSGNSNPMPSCLFILKQFSSGTVFQMLNDFNGAYVSFLHFFNKSTGRSLTSLWSVY